MTDCGESDKMIGICGKLDKSNFLSLRKPLRNKNEIKERNIALLNQL